MLTEGPQGVTETYSGGTDNADNSGTLRYVRIEFAGYDVSGGAGQELNSLSLYAVGSGTTLEYVQSLAGLDDSFEWWGGAVDGRYLVSYESGDDHFDWTEGYRGRNQFLIAFQSARLDPAAGAGCCPPTPRASRPTAATGRAATSGSPPSPSPSRCSPTSRWSAPATATTPTASGDIGMVLRRGTGGYLTNGIVARWQSQGLSVRDQETDDLMTADSLNLSKSCWRRTPSTTTRTPAATSAWRRPSPPPTTWEAGTAASLFTSLDPGFARLDAPGGSPAAAGAGTVVIPAEYTGAYFGGTLTNTTYFGAADPAGTKWGRAGPDTRRSRSL